MTIEFDTTDLTGRITSLQEELVQADQLNGRLVRLLTDILAAWDHKDEAELASLMGDIERLLGDDLG